MKVKKSLKIPKLQSESVYRRRTDNTMAKRKSTKGQTTINGIDMGLMKDSLNVTKKKLFIGSETFAL